FIFHQYPVRPATMTYDDVAHLSAKIKPKQQKVRRNRSLLNCWFLNKGSVARRVVMGRCTPSRFVVELVMAMDTLSPNYCRSKGEQIALNVDGTTSEDSNTYSTKLMDRQTFSSIQATNGTSRYAAAVFHRGELHLTPLHGILQLRPSFSYLDKADSKHREREAANEGGDSSQDEAEEDIKQITVRFSRPESEQARQRRIQSYEFLQKKQAEEPWVHLHYYGLKDGRSEHERQYLFCQCMGTTENTELVKTPSEYLAMLMPPAVEAEVAQPVTPSNVLSMAQLRTLPLVEQVKTLMKNVKVMPFANLMGLLTPGTDSTAVLRCVQQVAMLVQGNWVVKSDVLYPKDTCSPHSGVPADVLCRGRDFVLWKFTQERCVVRKEIAAVVKLPPEDVKDFLEQMAVARVNRGWEFLLPSDTEFVRKHPDVAQRQHMLWLGIQAKLEKVFQLPKESMMPKKPDSQPGVLLTLCVCVAGAVLLSGEQRVRAARERAQECQPALERELERQRAAGAVRVKEEPLSDGEEPMDTSLPAALNNGTPNGLPHPDEGPRDSANGPGPSRELRDFVSATFRKHFVLTLSELKRLFNLHLASLPPGHSLFAGISDRLLQDAILHSRCRQIQVPFNKQTAGLMVLQRSYKIKKLGKCCEYFPPQSSAAADEQKVFAVWEMGDSFDKHRQLLLELFSKNFRVRRSAIQTRLAQELGDGVTKADIDRLLKVTSGFQTAPSPHLSPLRGSSSPRCAPACGKKCMCT
ncbi:RPC5 polymerase, partial [Atractosteus spatula]|nr:RPC5 polymerase [Atractosteus spatula]